MSDPIRDALAAGFQALLRGDTKERDRQLERVRNLTAAQAAIPKVDIGRDAIVARLLRVAEYEAGRPLTDEESGAIKSAPAEFMKRLIASGYRMPPDLMC